MVVSLQNAIGEQGEKISKIEEEKQLHFRYRVPLPAKSTNIAKVVGTSNDRWAAA